MVSFKNIAASGHRSRQLIAGGAPIPCASSAALLIIHTSFSRDRLSLAGLSDRAWVRASSVSPGEGR
jgi:hypothetical protein